MAGKKYDVIVVGGGHAGCEAALASARMGASTLLITMRPEAIGYTSCNPSIGGIGKGQLVKEIDAMGGEMGKAADASCIQYRMLNSSKGYAARSSRMQIDRRLYNEYMRKVVLSQDRLDVVKGEAISIMAGSGECKGVVTRDGEYKSDNVVLTPGTFMNGILHIGLESHPGGRIDEKPSVGLSDSLVSMGFRVGSLKTGTPARLDGKTIDFSVLEEQTGDENMIPFSFSTEEITLPQKPCYITRTNSITHKIINDNIKLSPMYSGKIKSTGVRYCPSIEDKIVRFSSRDSHIVFLEPEGLDTDEYYPNGVSTSLPVKVQEEMLHSIKGLENVRINKPAYGIEYNYVDPTQLMPTLETKNIKGLFMSGQINGTTGYEEAAALGFISGVNAALRGRGEDPLVLDRSQAYIGVLIDDLVTRGTKEPYRMFTSRVEYRILIREDNADIRLTDTGIRLGILGEEERERVVKRQENVRREEERMRSVSVSPGGRACEILSAKGEKGVSRKMSLYELLKRPGISYDDILEIGEDDNMKLSYYEKVQIEVDVKYTGYIERELGKIRKFSDLEKIKVPEEFDYSSVPGLSNEIKEKLDAVRPVSLGQASRISGVTPAAISILMVRLRSK